MMKRLHATALALLVAAALAGCAKPVTEYGDAKGVETVTNEFGSTDLQTLAESMTRSLLNTQLIQQGNRPIVTIAEVRNKTSEYIDTQAITASIRSQLLKSGSVRFAVDIKDMEAQVAELRRQADKELYDQNSTQKTGRMLGAAYRLEGDLSSIVKQTKEVKDVYYKLSLRLVNVQTGLIEWADEKDIRKTTTRK